MSERVDKILAFLQDRWSILEEVVSLRDYLIELEAANESAFLSIEDALPHLDKRTFKFFFLLGNPTWHSYSPSIHNHLSTLDKSNLLYLPLSLQEDEVKYILENWSKIPMVGANVTYPYKESIYNYLHEKGRLSFAALAIGAVNTIYYRNGFLQGENSDWFGWLRSWKISINEDIRGKKAVVFGAGGAARAVIYALIQENIGSIKIINSPLRGRKLKQDMDNFCQETHRNINIVAQEYLHVGEVADIYINATPCGQVGFAPNLGVNWQRLLECDLSNSVGCDLVSNPTETLFVCLFAQRGRKVLKGRGMLVNQAREARSVVLGKAR
ncbi:hypothetical protein IJT10_03520 [bacterium]|nr:hypothetical protein [bacterium]